MKPAQATSDRPPLPPAAQRYLAHALDPAAPSQHAIIADITGRMKLKDRWYAFDSTLRVDGLTGFRWDASVRRGLMRFKGHDMYRAGVGEMVWRLFGLPIVKASDDNVTRSGRHRAALEQVFLPWSLARPSVSWARVDERWVRASWLMDGERVEIDLSVAEDGALRAARSERWSNALGDPWRKVTFGAEVLAEGTWLGATIPSRVRAGWFYGTDRWEEGVFWEGTVRGLVPG